MASRNSAHSAGAAGVGHVAGDEDEIERIGGMNGGEARQDPIAGAHCRAGRRVRFRCESRIARRSRAGRRDAQPASSAAPDGAASNAARSTGCSMLASAKPQISDATAR